MFCLSDDVGFHKNLKDVIIFLFLFLKHIRVIKDPDNFQMNLFLFPYFLKWIGIKKIEKNNFQIMADDFIGFGSLCILKVFNLLFVSFRIFLHL